MGQLGALTFLGGKNPKSGNSGWTRGKRCHVIRAIISIWILLASLIGVFAQTQTAGRLTGTVKDVQNAVIVAAHVEVENSATGGKYSASTDDKFGNFSVFPLPPGTYEVRVSATGFATELFRAVSLMPDQAVTINATLHVAQTSSEVTVNDEAPLVRSDTPELGITLDTHSVDELPLPTRNFLQLLTLAPGVSTPVTNNNTLGRNSPNVSINGGRVTQNGYLEDTYGDPQLPNIVLHGSELIASSTWQKTLEMSGLL